MAIPQRDRFTNWWRASISARETTTIMIFLLVTKTPPMSKVRDLIREGKRTRWAPRRARFPVSRMIPIMRPVIAAEALGAERRGR